MQCLAIALVSMAVVSSAGPSAVWSRRSVGDVQELPSVCPTGILHLQGVVTIPDAGVVYPGNCILTGVSTTGATEVRGSPNATVVAGGQLELNGSLAFTLSGTLRSQRGSVVLRAGAEAHFHGWRVVADGRHISLAGVASFSGTGPQPALLARQSVFVDGSAAFANLTGPAISAGSVNISGTARFAGIDSSSGAITAGAHFEGRSSARSLSPTALPGSVIISGTASFEDCRSSRSGGAIAVNTSLMGRVDISGKATFTDCGSNVSGGAIAASSVSISGRASFARCSASSGGGAISSGGGSIALPFVAGMASLSISGAADFSGCSATYGSAVATTGANVTGSAAFRQMGGASCSTGGALFLQPGARAFLSGLRFERISGAAVWSQAAADLTITRTFLKDVSLGCHSPAINADVSERVKVSHTQAEGIQSFLTAQDASGIYLYNVSIEGCANLTNCVDVSAQVFGTGAVDMVSFKATRGFADASLSVDTGAMPWPVGLNSRGRMPLSLYHGVGTVAANDDRDGITASCPPGTYPTWTVTYERAFSANTSDGRDCSFSQPEGCCMYQYNGWGLCKRAKYSEVSKCNTSCTCLQSSMLAKHGCTCSACKSSYRRYMHRLSCVPCPDGTISMAEAVLTTTGQRTEGVYANNTCIPCARTLGEGSGGTLDCSGDTIEVPAGIMVLKEEAARAALRVNMTCTGRICAFHCSNPVACQRSRRIGPDFRATTPMCLAGHDEGFPGCSRCSDGYGRATYDPFVCRRCGTWWTAWGFWLLAPVVPLGLGMRSACGVGSSQDAPNDERAQRRQRFGEANSILKILIAFCTLCNVVVQSLQATTPYGNAEKWLLTIMGIVEHGASSFSLLSNSHDCILGSPTSPMWQWLMLQIGTAAALLLGTFIIYIFPGWLRDARSAHDGSSTTNLLDADCVEQDGDGRWSRWWRARSHAPAGPPVGLRVRSFEHPVPVRDPRVLVGPPAAGEGVELEEDSLRVTSCPPVHLGPSSKQVPCFRRRLVRVTVVLGNTMLPAIAGGFARLWPCVQVQRGSGRAFSAYGLNDLCTFGVWPAWGRVLVGAVGLSFCVATGPLYWWWLLKEHWSWWLHVRQRVATPDCADWKLIGYLTKHYKLDWMWWEICVLLRKGVLVVSTAMTPASYAPESHLHVPLVTITVALLVQVKVQPYTSSFVNKVETTSLMVSLGLLVLSSWTIHPTWNQPEWLCYASMVMVLLLMAGTIAALVWLFFQATIGPRCCRRCGSRESHADVRPQLG